jgi:hypothetical protein
VSITKFTPSSFGGTVDPVYGAGTLSPFDNRISVPSSITVHANTFKTLRISVNPGLPVHTIVQGWIKLHGEGNNDLHFAYYAKVGPLQ